MAPTLVQAAIDACESETVDDATTVEFVLADDRRTRLVAAVIYAQALDRLTAAIKESFARRRSVI